MATISTIGTSSRNYSTVASWLAAFATGGWEGQCYNDSEFLVTSTIAFSGHATSATDYIKLSAASGQGFGDNANKLTNALKYNQSNGVGIRCNTKYVDTISISEDYVTLVGLQVSQSATGGGGGQIPIRATTNSQTHGVFDSLIVENTSGTGNQGVINAKEQTIKNCLLVQRGTSGDGIFLSYPASAGLIINCTIVRPSDITAADNGIHSTSGSWKAVNTAIFGFTNFSSGGTPTGCSNNASDVTIGTGSANQASKTYSSQFVTTTDAARDFRAKAGADLLENATSTGAPSTDIVGTSRPQGSAYDIGCWELVSGGVTAALTGNSSTAGRGTLAVQHANALTGNSVTAGRGTLAPKTTVALTGNSVTASEGTLTPSVTGPVTVAITGNAMTAGRGTLGVQHANALTGNATTAGRGTLAPKTTVALTGNAVTAFEGTLTPSQSGPVTVAITGLRMTAFQGTVIAFNPSANVGGHFIPLTEKQLRELKKRERKDRRTQEDLDQARKLDADSIEAEIRSAVFPQAATVINAEDSVEIADNDPEDADLEVILLYA